MRLNSLKILQKAKPGINFALETITRDPLKVPCLTDKYWATFAEIRGHEFARSLRMVRENPAKELQYVSQLPLEKQAEVERRNVLASLDYARQSLGL